jgi:hypothetical protein
MITIQREQYGVTVYLFVGTGRSPDKITFTPLTSTFNHNANYQGLSSLFPLGRFCPSSLLTYQAEAPLAIASASIHVAFGLYPHITRLHPKAEASYNSLCHTENIWLVTFLDLRKRKAPQHGPLLGDRRSTFGAHPRPGRCCVAGIGWWSESAIVGHATLRIEHVTTPSPSRVRNCPLAYSCRGHLVVSIGV